MKVLSQVISWLFNPLILPTYVILALCFIPVYPDYYENMMNSFYDMPVEHKFFYIKSFFIFGFAAPGLSLYIMSRTGFITSVELDERKERFVPMAVTLMYCFLLWFLFRNIDGTTMVPKHAYSMCVAGGVVAIYSGIINNWTKISLHAGGSGMMLGLLFSYYMQHHPYTIWPIIGAILLSACIIGARLFLGKHTNFQVYLGLISTTLITFILDFYVY